MTLKHVRTVNVRTALQTAELILGVSGSLFTDVFSCCWKVVGEGAVHAGNGRLFRFTALKQ